jgi:tRNA threonylcarbamoyladenosine modification (KEOPS) complex Cgi121 subunit
MRKLPGREMIIDATEPKSVYLQRMEEFHQAWANKRHERDLQIHIKEMHTHMREKWEEELRIREEQLKKRKKKHVALFHCSQ